MENETKGAVREDLVRFRYGRQIAASIKYSSATKGGSLFKGIERVAGKSFATMSPVFRDKGRHFHLRERPL